MIPDWGAGGNLWSGRFGNSHLALMLTKREMATVSMRFRLYGQPKSCYNIPTPNWLV
jgi:hypothetical protein